MITANNQRHQFQTAGLTLGLLASSVVPRKLVKPKVNPADSKVHGANMGPTWGRQDPGGSHVGHMKIAIWTAIE